MHKEIDLLQTVGHFYHPIDAEIARGLLESECLDPFLHSQHHAWANWTLCVALGGIRLQVPYWQAEEAAELLSQLYSSPILDTCEACGSTKTELVRARWRISFLLFHFLSIPWPFDIKNRKCSSCGVQWEEQ